MSTRTREQFAAATGLVVAALFGVAFVIGLSPKPPGLDAPAGAWAQYIQDNQDAIRVQTLLISVAMLFFLWFLGSVRAGLRGAEGGAGRVSAIASGGGLVGTGFVLLAAVFAATATLRPDQTDAEIIRLLVDLEFMSIGIGASAFAVFFLGVAVASILDGGLPKVLGYLALIAAAAAAIGVVTLFTDSGIFAADGAFGYWVRYGAFVAWVAIASAVLFATVPKTTRRRR